MVTRSRTDNRALLVGMAYYADASLPDLGGVRRDVDELADVLTTDADGSPNFEVTRIVSTADAPLSTEYVLNQLDMLIDEVENNHLVFYFSGHGVLGPFGFQLATAEKKGAFDAGIHFDVLLHRFNEMEGPVTVILDCCYSGAAGDTHLLVGGQSLVMTYLREDVTILASSGRAQVSLAEPNEMSDYTRVVVETLRGDGGAPTGAAIDALSVHARARSRLSSQTPVVRLFGAAAHCLRRV